MALHPPNQEADQRRFSSLSEIRFNARSFLEGFPTPTPSSRYSHQSLPEHTEREHRRRSSGFNAIRDMLGHGRHASASARSSTSHLPLTQSEDIEHGEHDHHEEDDEDEELEELETRQNHHSMIYSPLSRPQSWHIAPPTEPHPALLRPREPSISPPRFREERDLEAQTTTTNTSPAAQRRRKKKKKRSNNGGYWLRRTPGTTRRERETCVPDTIKGRTTGTMVTGFVLIVLISTCKSRKHPTVMMQVFSSDFYPQILASPFLNPPTVLRSNFMFFSDSLSSQPLASSPATSSASQSSSATLPSTTRTITRTQHVGVPQTQRVAALTSAADRLLVVHESHRKPSHPTFPSSYTSPPMKRFKPVMRTVQSSPVTI